MNEYERFRHIMKSHHHELGDADIAKGLPQPIIEKEANPGDKKIPLPPLSDEMVPKTSFFECLMKRGSKRNYTGESISMNDLSFILWSTQGVKKVTSGYEKYLKDGINVFKTVPSAGCVHSFETYIAVLNVDGLEQGIYRYLSLTHELTGISQNNHIAHDMGYVIARKNPEKHYITKAAIAIFWVCTPYKGEWRYQEKAHKVMMIDVGHIGQNLYLAAEALRLGCVCFGGYKQHIIDELLGVDGENEFTVYCGAVGKVP